MHGYQGRSALWRFPKAYDDGAKLRTLVQKTTSRVLLSTLVHCLRRLDTTIHTQALVRPAPTSLEA